jgi:hypothetical protein
MGSYHPHPYRKVRHPPRQHLPPPAEDEVERLRTVAQDREAQRRLEEGRSARPSARSARMSLLAQNEAASKISASGLGQVGNRPAAAPIGQRGTRPFSINLSKSYLETTVLLRDPLTKE